MGRALCRTSRRGPWLAGGFLAALLAGAACTAEASGADAGAAARERAGPLRASPRALLAALPLNPAAIASAQDLLGAPARVSLTDHFAVVSSAEVPVDEGLLSCLEGVYRAHVRFLVRMGVRVTPPAGKLVVVLHHDEDRFLALAAERSGLPTHTLGFFDPHQNAAFLLDLSAASEVRALTAPAPTPDVEQTRLRGVAAARCRALELGIVRHEAAHLIQWNVGLLAPAQLPAWLAEGLAMCFERPFTPDGEPLDQGAGSRLTELSAQLEAGRLDAGRVAQWLADEQAWCGAPCYPAAWAVTRYLDVHQPGALGTLLRRLASGDALPSDPQARAAELADLFGPLDALAAAAIEDAVRLGSGAALPSPATPAERRRGPVQRGIHRE